MERIVDGATLATIAEQLGLTVEGVCQALAREERRELDTVAEQLDDGPLWFDVPADIEGLARTTHYVRWLVAGLGRRGIATRTSVDVVDTPDVSFRLGLHPEREGSSRMALTQTRSPQSRMALNDMRRRLHGLRSQRAEARREFKQANDDGDNDAIKVTGARLLELDEDISKAKELETRALSALAGVSDELGQSMRHDLDAQARLQEIASSQAPLQGYVQVGQFMTAAEMCELFGQRSAQMWGATVTTPDTADLPGHRIRPSVQPAPLPPLSLLDLFPAYPTGERSVSYMQLNGAPPSGADVVAHGAVKPGVDITYDAESAEVPTTAVWTKCPRQDIEDFDGLAASIQTLLSYDVRRKLEALLVAAIGVRPASASRRSRASPTSITWSIASSSVRPSRRRTASRATSAPGTRSTSPSWRSRRPAATARTWRCRASRGASRPWRSTAVASSWATATSEPRSPSGAACRSRSARRPTT
jgi:hypothetical protein